jgi:hypothetical protein
MIRKEHLQHTVSGGPTCQSGRLGGQLRGEHLSSKYSEFSALPVEQRCARCENSPLFAFLKRQAAKALATTTTDKIIQHDDTSWRVVSAGAKRNGETFCHLAAVARFQRDGKTPAQINDWVSNETLANARRT